MKLCVVSVRSVGTPVSRVQVGQVVINVWGECGRIFDDHPRYGYTTRTYKEYPFFQKIKGWDLSFCREIPKKSLKEILC